MSAVPPAAAVLLANSNGLLVTQSDLTALKSVSEIGRQTGCLGRAMPLIMQ